MDMRSNGWHALWLAILVCLAGRSGLAQQTASTGKQNGLPNGTVVRAKTVTLAVENVTVREALYAVARDAGLAVSFNGGDSVLKARLAGRVSARFDAVPLADALAQVMRNTGYSARISDDGAAVMIVRGKTTRTAKRGGSSISGRVVDSTTGRGLSSAIVSMQGIHESVTTNGEGRFVWNDLPAGEYVLTVRLFGYRPATRAVSLNDSATASVRIALVSAPNLLSGVVTTATGRQNKIEIGNSIPTLNVDSIMRVAPVTSIADLLEARVPGVEVTRTSGTPGDPTRIRIRGAASITRNNDPIVIVDGIRVYAAQSDARNLNLGGTAFPANDTRLEHGGSYATPSPIDQIDPNMVESIEIFKGPSATSQWGADAANGVIVINTKKGRPGPAHMTARAEHGWTYMPGKYPENIRRWGHLFNGASQPYSLSDAYAYGYTLDSIVRFQTLNDPRYTVFGRGAHDLVSMGVSGGQSAVTYSLTGTLSGDLGIMKLPEIEVDRFAKFHGSDPPTWMRRPDKYDTWAGGGTVRMQVTPSLSIAYEGRIFGSAQQRSSLDGALSTLMSLYVDTTQLAQTGLIEQFYERARSNQLRFTNSVSPQWQPFAWLPLTGSVGLDVQLNDNNVLLPRGYYVNPNIPRDSLGRYGANEGRATTTTANIYTRIPTSVRIGELTMALGFDVTRTSTRDLTSITDSLAVGVMEPQQFYHASTVLNTISTTTYGWFVEPRLNLHSRFFVTPGFRLDGGSASGSRARVGGLPSKFGLSSLFPKINVSWLASDEPRFPAKRVVSTLQLKGAFGHAGVQPAPQDQLRTYGDDIPRMLDGVYSDNIATIRGLGNTKLHPERSTEIEGGFVLGLVGDRFQIDFTRYRKNRVDAILDVPVAPSVAGGAREIKMNIGTVLNTGTEASVNADLLRTRPISWAVNFGYDDNKNLVKKLAPGVAQLVSSNSSRILPGYPLESRWARPIISYADADGDGVIRPDEVRLGDSLVYVGQQDPRYTLLGGTNIGLFNSRMTVNASFSYVNGQSQFNEGGYGFLAQAVNDPKISPGMQAAFMALVANPGSNYGLIQTVRSFRVQSMSVNYLVPESWTRRLRVPAMTVGLQGSNLGLWTNYRGKDPNVNAFSAGNETGDAGELPQPRKWQLQIMFN